MKKFLILLVLSSLISFSAYAGSEGQEELSKNSKPMDDFMNTWLISASFFKTGTDREACPYPWALI